MIYESRNCAMRICRQNARIYACAEGTGERTLAVESSLAPLKGRKDSIRGRESSTVGGGKCQRAFTSQGPGPGAENQWSVLGAMELLARYGGKIGFFRPVVEDATSDHLLALVMSRYEVMIPRESMFGATYAYARDLISDDKEDELYTWVPRKVPGRGARK